MSEEGKKMQTVHLEDHGQDFLEWDIKDGVVVDCRPFQGWYWNGTKVHSTDLQPGLLLDITTTNGNRTRLRYPIEEVTSTEGTAGAKITKEEQT